MIQQSLLNLRRHATRLLAFLFLAVLGIGQVWAVDPTLSFVDWPNSNPNTAFGDIFKTHDCGVTLGTDATAWKGNFSGHYYICSGGGTDLSATAWSNYMSIVGTSKIDSIAVLWVPNGTSATNVAWCGWESAADRVVDAHGETPALTSSKSYDSRAWQTIDLTSYDLKIIYLSRQFKKVKETEGGSDLQFGKNATVNILGIKVWLKAASNPYTVTFDANGGTCGTSNLTEESAGAGVTLPSATANTGYTFLGWATTDDATEAAYKAGATYKPSADVTLYAVYEVFVQKYAVNFAAGDGTGSMDTKMYAEGATVTLPSCDFTAPDGKVFAGWSDGVNTYDAGDEFTMSAQAVTFTAQWEKVFGQIVNVTLNGGTNHTFNKNLIGATFDTNLSSGKYKADKGKYIGLIGNFIAGDTLTINSSTAGTAEWWLFNSKGTPSDANLIAHETTGGDATSFVYILTSDQSALYINRSSDDSYSKWNPTVASISVTRPRAILSQNYWGFKKNGASLSNPEDYTWNEGVVTMNEPFKSVAAPDDYTWTNHITYEGDLTEDISVPVEFALNGNFWEATKTFDDQTVTIKVPVDKTLNVYVHFVEDWNGTAVWGAIAGNWSDLSSSTETIGGATWYKMSYNNVAATDIQISNGNGSNSVVFNVAADKTNAVYYVAYNSWDDSNFRVAEVAEPIRKTINIYFQNPGWPSVSEFKMWVEDGVNGANVYGTTVDYDFTTNVTYAGETWYNATVHYFGDNCTIYPKFMENDVQWEAAAGINGSSENIYIYYNNWSADVNATHKTFNAGVATNMLYAVGAGTAATDVTEATVWDWTKTGAASNVQLSDNSYPNRYTDFVVANLLAENANFKSSALTMTTEYIVRDKKYAQATSVKFHTTVPGMVTVVFSNTGGSRPNRYLHVNGVSTGVGSNASTEKHKTATAFVGAGDVLINAYFDEKDFTGTEIEGVKTWTDNSTKYSTGNQMLRIYSITFTPDYSRTVDAGKFGTICLPYAVSEEAVTASGFTFYNIESKTLENGSLKSIALAEQASLEPGVPYLFEAPTGEGTTTLTLALSDDKVNEPVNKNGLVGTLTGGLAMPNATANPDAYFVSTADNKLHRLTGTATATIGANKAYIDLTNVSEAAPAAPARIIYAADFVDQATGLDNLNATDMQKFMQDGKLYIRVADRIYDATGRLVK